MIVHHIRAQGSGLGAKYGILLEATVKFYVRRFSDRQGKRKVLP